MLWRVVSLLLRVSDVAVNKINITLTMKNKLELIKLLLWLALSLRLEKCRVELND